LRKLKVIDPVRRQGTVSRADLGELSPMDPPNPYAPPGKVDVPLHELHPFLRDLVEEHVRLKARVQDFEACLASLQEERALSRDVHVRLQAFFHAFDAEFVRHSRKEERDLFPLTRLRLLETGEHSPTRVPVTGVDVLQREHVDSAKAVTTVSALLSTIPLLEDPKSREILLDAAIGTGKEFAEAINLHMFREDQIMFPLAHTLLTSDELDAIARPYAGHIEHTRCERA
jgi:iron-sulfur cluster repair protein YtfE (RIC family)